jgi:pimeloyl-ACP methyl ester carboxylesterase
MSRLPSPFKTSFGQAEYMKAYDATLRLWDVPFETVQIENRFGQTHVVVSGPKDAPPLVILHCFFTSLTSWANNIADLIQRYRVYAPDLIGQPGRSIPDQPIANRAELAEWMSLMLDALGLRRVDLAGYSYGGFTALNYAVHQPQRLKKLVLLSPAGAVYHLRPQFWLRGFVTAIPGLAEPAMRSMFRWMFYQPNLQSDNVRPLAQCIMSQMVLGRKHFRIGMIVPPTEFPDVELRAVNVPTLLLIGDREVIYNPVRAIERACALLPQVQAELISGAGHDLPVTKFSMVDGKVLAFLDRGYSERVPDTARPQPVAA